MKKDADSMEPEFSLPLAVDKIPPSGLEQTVVASEAQRARLAKRFELLGLSRLEARLDISPARVGRMIAVKGTVTADATQQCVVSLEPLPAHIEQEIDVLFGEPGLMSEEGGEAGMEDEELEPIIDGVIDLGELLAQHLGVALDPYPRKPGLEYVEAQYGDKEEKANPFAVLATFKKTPKK